MRWELATKPQLLQIALNEDCDLAYKYQACAELQMRWNNDMLLDVVKMVGKGCTGTEIAEYLGISVETVGGIISKYNLRRTLRNENEGRTSTINGICDGLRGE